jgi:hypothetical protein
MTSMQTLRSNDRQLRFSMTESLESGDRNQRPAKLLDLTIHRLRDLSNTPLPSGYSARLVE